MLVVFFFLLWVHKHKRFGGQVILLYALIYSVTRFMIEFVRDNKRSDLLGLTALTGLSTSQLLSIVVAITALVLLVIRWRKASAIAKTEGQLASTAAHKVQGLSLNFFGIGILLSEIICSFTRDQSSIDNSPGA